MRDADGQIYVLEDNLRCPSGVSYVLENREVMKRTFPQVFDGLSILPVDDYPERLLEMLQYIAPPGVARSDRRGAHAGHLQLGLFRAFASWPSRWASSWSKARDLVVSDGYVYMRTTQGLRAGRRDLSPHRRRLPRSADVPRRFDAGRARA